MGCDIHTFCEKRTKKGEWKALGLRRPREEDDDSPWDYNKPSWVNRKPVLNERDYRLFGLLTNGHVRDQDLAGLMCTPYNRMPDDCSKKVADIIEYYGVDGHSHHWYTFSELHEYLDSFQLKTRCPGLK